MECIRFCRTPCRRNIEEVSMLKNDLRQNHIHVVHEDLEPILHMYEDLLPILQMCDKIVLRQASSPKGNDRSPESHYKSMGTFKILNGS